MFRTRIENWKLRRQRRVLLKSKDEKLAGLSGEELQEAWAEWDGDEGIRLAITDARIKANESRELLDQAEKLKLPTPRIGQPGKWVPQEDFDMPAGAGHWNVLTPETFNELRAAIREEKRQRREVWEFWIKIIATAIAILTGLVGAAIGLVSVLKK